MKITKHASPGKAGFPVQSAASRINIGASGWAQASEVVLQRLCLGTVFCALSACVQPQNLVAGDKMSVDSPVYQVEMGSEREATVTAAAQKWLSEPACDIGKTGVGINRRAYFLEKCTFGNPQQKTICELAPEQVEYAFLEGELVQVLYRFSEADEATYGSCVENQALANGYAVSAESFASDTADTRRVRLVDSASGMSITIGEEREVRVYDTTLVPTIHQLRNMI